jgi:hypothetical protein
MLNREKNLAAALELGFTPTVYSLFYPEAERIIDQVSHPYPHAMYTEAWTKKQDPMHDEFLETWQVWSRCHLPDVDWSRDFVHSYPCNGSSEAIRESLAQYAADRKGRGTVHMFSGEYEGYRAIAEGYGLQMHFHNRYEWRESIAYDFAPGDVFYISHPSSLDGNIWPDIDEFIKTMASKWPDVKIRLDLCYLGTTSTGFRVKHAGMFNVDMLFFSLSKVFGVYYHRIGGVFSKRPLPGLYGNKWFKNLFSLKLGTSLMRNWKPYELPAKYKPLQEQAVAQINQHSELAAKASDVILLAHANSPLGYSEAEGPAAEWEVPLIRHDFVRYCLTPYMGRELKR